MSDLLVVSGHPETASLSAALARQYADGAAQHSTVSVLELATLRFDPNLRRSPEQALEPDLVAAREAITAARHVAWFFPTWWAGPPALVKGFIDRVFTPGFAYRYRDGRALHERLLRGRSARLVTTMDAPWWWYTAIYQRALHAAFTNATLRFVGFSVASTTLYGVRDASPRKLQRALEAMTELGARDARQRRGRLAALPATTKPAALPRSSTIRCAPSPASAADGAASDN